MNIHEPKYCRKCGRPLKRQQYIDREVFDEMTGEKRERVVTRLTCPKAGFFSNINPIGHDDRMLTEAGLEIL